MKQDKKENPQLEKCEIIIQKDDHPAEHIQKLDGEGLIVELQEACNLLEDTKKNQEPETEKRIQDMIDSIDEACYRLRNKKTI